MRINFILPILISFILVISVSAIFNSAGEAFKSSLVADSYGEILKGVDISNLSQQEIVDLVASPEYSSDFTLAATEMTTSIKVYGVVSMAVESILLIILACFLAMYLARVQSNHNA